MILLVLYCGILVSCRSQFVLFESFIFYRGCCVNILDNAQRVRSISETERVRSKQGRTWSCELVHRRITGSNRWINSVRLSFVSIIHTLYITGDWLLSPPPLKVHIEGAFWEEFLGELAISEIMLMQRRSSEMIQLPRGRDSEVQNGFSLVFMGCPGWETSGNQIARLLMDFIRPSRELTKIHKVETY